MELTQDVKDKLVARATEAAKAIEYDPHLLEAGETVVTWTMADGAKAQMRVIVTADEDDFIHDDTDQ